MMKKQLITVLWLALMATACAQPGAPASGQLPESQTSLRTGAERLETYLPELAGKRVALCGNQTSVVGNTHLVDTLLASKVNLLKLFCPEHGFRTG